MPVAKKSDCYFIGAGEYSGDLLGADLALALHDRFPKLHAFGISGPTMAKAGVEPIAAVNELSVMGITEVAKKLADLRMLESRILQRIDQRAPRFAILIDNPGFNLRLAEQLKLRGIKVFQYVAPKLWAWGAGRAQRIKRDIDTVLGILPFEAEYFAALGINYQYVGSPLKDRIEKIAFTKHNLGLPTDRPLIACLPGSREAELRLILPVMVRVRDLVKNTLPKAMFLVPVAANLKWENVAACLHSLGFGITDFKEHGPDEALAIASYRGAGLHFVRGMSLEVLAAADAAIVASGTATLECGLLGTPMVVVYAVSDLTYSIARHRVRLPYFSLINLVAQRRLVHEYIQEFSTRDVAQDLLSLLCDNERRQRLKIDFEELRDKLKGHAAETAASVIADRCV